MIDPKADLIDTILERVPPAHADRIVVLDPGDSSRSTTWRALLLGVATPTRVRDVLTGTLKSSSAGWGVRSRVLRSPGDPHASARCPGRPWPTWVGCFPASRSGAQPIARLRDPFLLSSWQQYRVAVGRLRRPSTSKPRWRG